MATTARTPPIGRLAGRPSAPQLTTARPVRTINSPTRPETPSFLDPNVSGVFSTLMHHPTPTGNGLGRPLPRASTNINLGHQVEPNQLKKRQIEVVDLTQTDDQTSSVPAKRLKVEPLVMDRVDPLGPPRRKPTQAIPTGADKRDRQDHHDKMAEESAQWRAKYKKAFPSFVFYFDQLDPTTEAYLIKQVRSLGAVRSTSFAVHNTPPAFEGRAYAETSSWLTSPTDTFAENTGVLLKRYHPRCHVAQRSVGLHPCRQQGERCGGLTTPHQQIPNKLGSHQARLPRRLHHIKAPSRSNPARPQPVRRFAGYPAEGVRVRAQDLEDRE